MDVEFCCMETVTSMGQLSFPRQRRAPGAYAAGRAVPHVDLSRLGVTLSQRLREPGPWIGAMVSMLFAIVVWQHPIARTIGTEATPGSIPAVLPAELAATTAPVITAPTAATTPTAHVVEHAPVDPFRPLVSAEGARRAALALHPSATHHVGGTQHSLSTATTVTAASGADPATGAAPAASAGSAAAPTTHGNRAAHHGGTQSCAAVHVVTAGESLWSIVERSSPGAGIQRTITNVQAVYAANRSGIGADPSLLAVGQRLCLPTT
jgi:hypothetical protein